MGDLRDSGRAAERTNTVKAKRKIGDLGGVVEQDVRRVPKADLTLVGQPLALKNINIAPQPETGEAARLGDDVLAAYSAVVFDFNAMTFSVSPQGSTAAGIPPKRLYALPGNPVR